jgi:hypothetical protein
MGGYTLSFDRSNWDKYQAELSRENKDHENQGTKEEFSTELAAPTVSGPVTEKNSERSTKPAELNRSKTIGYAALFVALLSMFILPVVLGPAAIILGFMAYRGGKRGLGTWSVALGLLSFAAYFLLLTFYS